MKSLFSKKNRSRTLSFGLVILAYIIIEMSIKTGSISYMMKTLLVPCCCYIVAALALNLCVGFSGELSLGHAGFMAIGGFMAVCVSGVLSSTIASPVLRLIIAMLISSAVTALFGYLIAIPVLKLQGDYLAIVTLAFCQIIKSIINNIYLGIDENGLQFSFVENRLNLTETGKTLIAGPMGATGTDRIASFAAGFILIIVTLFVIFNLINSRNGRAIMASRDNRIAALSVGINPVKIKTLAFVLSAALTGAAGALYGLNYSTLVPSGFDFNLSILILVYVVLGGLGNITGTLISTTCLFILPELLRSFSDYRMIVYSIVLIVIMLVTNNETIKNFVNKIFSKGGPQHEQ